LDFKFLLGNVEGANAVEAHDIFIDNVVLEVKNAPVKRPPTLRVDTTEPYTNRAVDITFANDEEWLNAAATVKVNDVALTTKQYTLSAGTLTIAASLFPTAAQYTVTVEAEGYAPATVEQDILFNDGNLI
jgi:hypothetical protein